MTNRQTDTQRYRPATDCSRTLSHTLTCDGDILNSGQERDVVITLYLAPLSDLMVGILYTLILSVQGKRYLFGIAKIQRWIMGANCNSTMQRPFSLRQSDITLAGGAVYTVHRRVALGHYDNTRYDMILTSINNYSEHRTRDVAGLLRCATSHQISLYNLFTQNRKRS